MSVFSEGELLLKTAAACAGQITQPGFRRVWLNPFVLLAGFTLSVFVCFYSFDLFTANNGELLTHGIINNFL